MSESSENTSTSETESEDEYDETDSDDGTLIYKLSNIEDRERMKEKRKIKNTKVKRRRLKQLASRSVL